MNIFVLSFNFVECAQDMVDRHVVKMILEYCQLLSTAHHILDSAPKKDIIYKPTHVNHPCAKWVRESSANYMWLVQMLGTLLDEYTYRYNKVHACTRLYLYFKDAVPEKIPIGDLTPFALAMPDECKVVGDPVKSYRLYYITHKSNLFSWKKRQRPLWITETLPSSRRSTGSPDPLQ